jgi:hypothetical protein
MGIHVCRCLGTFFPLNYEVLIGFRDNAKICSEASLMSDFKEIKPPMDASDRLKAIPFLRRPHKPTQMPADQNDLAGVARFFVVQHTKTGEKYTK